MKVIAGNALYMYIHYNTAVSKPPPISFPGCKYSVLGFLSYDAEWYFQLSKAGVQRFI